MTQPRSARSARTGAVEASDRQNRGAIQHRFFVQYDAADEGCLVLPDRRDVVEHVRQDEDLGGRLRRAEVSQEGQRDPDVTGTLAILHGALHHEGVEGPCLVHALFGVDDVFGTDGVDRLGEDPEEVFTCTAVALDDKDACHGLHLLFRNLTFLLYHKT